VRLGPEPPSASRDAAGEPMNDRQPLRLLLLEDSSDDAEIVLRELRRGARDQVDSLLPL